MRLAHTGSVIKGSDPTKLGHELSNIQLEYEVIHSKELREKSMLNYLKRKRFLYELVTHHTKGLDSIINKSINVPRISMKGLFFFYEPHAEGVRDSEKTCNRGIIQVTVNATPTPNKVYSQGIKMRDRWMRYSEDLGRRTVL